MKILEVSRYKNNFTDHQLPFVTEQGEALRNAGCEVVPSTARLTLCGCAYGAGGGE